jgi:transcriptional regulator with XRE-family HTH domain
MIRGGRHVSLSAPNPTETVGARLRRLRLERGFSQRELSGPGVSYAYISRIEAGERRPSVKALRVLAAKLGVSAEYLETGSEMRADEERELHLADAELAIRLADDPAEATSKLEELLADAVEAGDAGHATRARLALGLAAAQAGNVEEAIERLEQAVADSTIPPHARPDVFGTLGQSYASVGRYDDSIALFQRCVAQVEQDAPADSASYVRFATYLSYAYTDAGKLEHAEQVMKDALARVKRSADPYTRVRIYWSLARLSDVEGKSMEALDYVRKAIALLEATDDTLHLARAHLLCAGIVLAQRDADEATTHLELAETLFGGTAEPADLALLRLNQARAATMGGGPARAETLARESLELYGTHNEGDRGEAWLALGEALAAQGRTADAENALGEAIELLDATKRTREAAQARDALERVRQPQPAETRTA